MLKDTGITEVHAAHPSHVLPKCPLLNFLPALLLLATRQCSTQLPQICRSLVSNSTHYNLDKKHAHAHTYTQKQSAERASDLSHQRITRARKTLSTLHGHHRRPLKSQRGTNDAMEHIMWIYTLNSLITISETQKTHRSSPCVTNFWKECGKAEGPPTPSATTFGKGFGETLEGNLRRGFAHLTAAEKSSQWHHAKKHSTT